VGIKILKKPNLSKLIRTISATEEELASVATHIIIGIQERTQKGYDADGVVFKPYSEEYLEYRVKNKRSSEVNLTFNGHMLHSMKTKKVRDGTAIVFDNTIENDKADFNHNKMKREFFALDGKQERYIIDTIGDFISKSLK
jgi:hypothetical protein